MKIFALLLLIVDLYYQQYFALIIVVGYYWDDGKINVTQWDIICRNLLSQLIFLQFTDSTSVIEIAFVSLHHIVCLLIIENENNMVSLIGIEIIGGIYLITHYQNDISIVAAIFNYVIIFVISTTKYDPFFADIVESYFYLSWVISTFSIFFLQNDLWIIIYHLTHTMFTVLRYRDVSNSRFLEFTTLCEHLDTHPCISLGGRIFKMNFSLSTHMLFCHHPTKVFISDKNKQKKYFEFLYDHNNVHIILSSALTIKSSKFYSKIVQFDKIKDIEIHIPIAPPHVKEIFTFKIYCLIKRFVELIGINDIIVGISLSYIALIKRGITNVYNIDTIN